MPTRMPEHQRAAGEDDRVHQASHDLRADGRAAHDAIAELALEGVREPEDVADRERLVEAVALDDRLARRLVDAELRSDEGVGEVARGERDEREDEDRDPEEHRDADQEAADDEGGHRPAEPRG